MELEKIRSIFEQLNAINEQILSFSEDVFLAIDPRDNESLARGSEFIQKFNIEADKFGQQVNRIEELLLSYFDKTAQDLRPAVEEGNDKQINERLIRELDKNKAYTLYESFTYKRPYGFILHGIAYRNLLTWKAIYLKVLSIVQEQNRDKFIEITTDPLFISKRGNPSFSTSPDALRVAEKISDEIYAEVNLSANSIRENLIDILSFFDINPDQMQVYLREDRDA